MSLYRQGKVPGSFYDGYGQEAVSGGAAFAMAPQDLLALQGAIPILQRYECWDDLADIYRRLMARGARVRWTDLRMSVYDHAESRPANGGVVLSNWEI